MASVSAIVAELGALDKAALVGVCRLVAEAEGVDCFVEALAKRKAMVEVPAVKKKAFDMGRWRQRDVALWVSYDGDAYSGFASQGLKQKGVRTVEDELFKALLKCRLIDSKADCRYSRCGRTDKGVSALRQVVGLRLRSALSNKRDNADEVMPTERKNEEESNEDIVEERHRKNNKKEEACVLSRHEPASSKEEKHMMLCHPGDDLVPGKKELKYCEMLNRLLPEDVRIVAWRGVDAGFSARFSAASRTYRYFFRRRDSLRGYGGGGLGESRNLAKMRVAAEKLRGSHDFRNFCKMDVEHVSNFKRSVFEVSIREIDDDMAFLEIKGQAFLWHMVRCIAAVLLAVADGLEDPSVVDAMLDVDTRPSRPQYTLASEMPLVLWDCHYDTVAPLPTPETLLRLTDHLEKRLDEATIVAARRKDALDKLYQLQVRQTDLDDYYYDAGLLGNKTIDTNEENMRDDNDDALVLWGEALVDLRNHMRAKLKDSYRPLLERDCAMTYEERIDSLGDRKRERLQANDKKRQASEPHDHNFHATMRNFG